MALPTLAVKDASGSNVTIGTLPPGGQATAASSLPVVLASDVISPVDTVAHNAATDRGGTITAGGTAQQIMAANASRRGIAIQNQSTGDLYMSGVAGATVDYHSLKIPAGTLYETGGHVGAGAISIIGATTGQAFYAREW